MADFLESMLDGSEDTPVIVTEAPAAEPVAEAPAPEPVEPAAEVQAETVPEKQDGKFIPIGALMDERDKRKAAEERIRQFEAQQPKQAAIDPYDDPQGFAAEQQRLMDERVTQMRFEMSDRFARQQYGDEATKAAIEWGQSRAQSDPVFAASYMRENDPIGWMVQQHQRDGLLSQIGDRSLDDFVRDYVTQNGEKLGLTAPVAATPVIPTNVANQAPKPAPPRSIASDAPASGNPATSSADFVASILSR